MPTFHDPLVDAAEASASPYLSTASPDGARKPIAALGTAQLLAAHRLLPVSHRAGALGRRRRNGSHSLRPTVRTTLILRLLQGSSDVDPRNVVHGDAEILKRRMAPDESVQTADERLEEPRQENPLNWT